MAFLTRTDGTVLRHPDSIRAILAPLGVRLEEWPIPPDPEIGKLLEKSVLEPGESEALLEGFRHRFEYLRKTFGYQTQDLVSLYPDLPGLAAMLDRFVSCHTHADDEIRYIVEGSGVFGFVLSDGDQVELTLTAGDYINVPAGAEHWFRLTSSMKVKAIRYFTSREGWVPNYTGRPVLFPRHPGRDYNE